jgi:sulfonate transport system substrate-binding protein
VIASVVPAAAPTPSQAEGKRIMLAYCSQLLCGVPYEVARSAGLFQNHGLAVQLIYTRGGNATIQALVGGAVDYAATSLDVALQAYANVGADIRRFAVTG